MNAAAGVSLGLYFGIGPEPGRVTGLFAQADTETTGALLGPGHTVYGLRAP